MGAALYVVTEREVPEFDPFVNGKALSAAERKLSLIATDLGVTSLMDFFSIDPAEAAAFMEDEGVDGDVELPPATWFDADAGLATVNALSKHISDYPDSVPDSADVLSDLTEFQAVLHRLQSEGVRWHLGVDY